MVVQTAEGSIKNNPYSSWKEVYDGHVRQLGDGNQYITVLWHRRDDNLAADVLADQDSDESVSVQEFESRMVKKAYKQGGMVGVG